ncbi:TlpA family protein disulfide reductase [Aliibacillus thermotolerans]|uniref:TlpA family protein disulfide reductase n=1 Tax=Aliibacillus thermotolerans TaxID=1834418 RepID=A0ABW0U6A6_9BACI|nr:TlpA disulfide reductase family protein [Aliibacillus thermotolerans]MDA3128610.1 redoxin domain-containing protein [Aliibacillus thermotolerans]
MNKSVFSRIVLVMAVIAGVYVILTNLTLNKVGIEIGDQAPDYTLPTFEGESRSLSDYEGNIIVMNMWASWCEPCTREIPDLMKLHDTYDEVTLVTVNMNSYERNREDAEAFVRDFQMDRIPSLIDEEGEVASLYQLQHLPTTYVMDENRVIVDRIDGETTFEQLEARLANHFSHLEE